MKPLPTYEQVCAIIEYDPETGLFRWKVHQGGRRKKGWFDGTEEHGYRAISVCGSIQRAHRIAWLLMTKSWPLNEIDHRDCNRANNRWKNLRDVKHLLNSHNQHKASRNSKTRVLGVTIGKSRKSPYIASIRVNGKRLHLGSYGTIESAGDAYLSAKRQLHPGFVEPTASSAVSQESM